MDHDEKAISISFGETSGIDDTCIAACDYEAVAKEQVSNTPSILYGDGEVSSATVSDLSCSNQEVIAVRTRLGAMGRCLIAPERPCRLRGIVRLFDDEGQRVDEFEFSSNETT